MAPWSMGEKFHDAVATATVPAGTTQSSWQNRPQSVPPRSSRSFIATKPTAKDNTRPLVLSLRPASNGACAMPLVPHWFATNTNHLKCHPYKTARRLLVG
eukprot:629617-Amphidinium_carterae.1